MPKEMSPAEWYTVVAAILLLGLALLNNASITLIVSALGIIGGLLLVWRGPLKRGGVFAFAGCVIATALALFTLLR